MQNQPARGNFNVVEGIDGAGKTTQISLLTAWLKSRGRAVHTTAEPTNSTIGGIIRDALEGLTEKTACEMTALFVADRIFHNTNPVSGIRNILASGQDVICDRYYYSTLAYQGSMTDYDWVSALNLQCPDILKPDLCVFLDLKPEVSLDRIARNRSVTEIYENIDTLKKVRDQFFNVFEQLKSRDRICVIDAGGTVEEVSESIIRAVSDLF